MGGKVLRRILFPPEGSLACCEKGHHQQRYSATLQRSPGVLGPAIETEEIRQRAQGRCCRCESRRESMSGKARLLTLVVVFSNVAGNLLLSLGLKSTAGILSPLVFAGVGLLVLWTLCRITLMSWADLSYILPITSI